MSSIDEAVYVFIVIFICVCCFLFVRLCSKYFGHKIRAQRIRNRVRNFLFNIAVTKMTPATLIAVIICGVACVACFLWAACLKYCQRHDSANQQEDIYNISSRVQGQGQWPTHDTHVSIDHFTIANEINKYNDDPPTYEEAMSIAASNNNNTVVPAVVPKTTTTHSAPDTTATSASN